MHPRLAHFNSIILPTYSVVVAIGLVVALLLAEWCAPRAGLSRERVGTLGLTVLCVTVVLSRVALIAELWPAFRTYPRLVLTLPTLTKFGPVIVFAAAAGTIAAMRLPWLRTLDAATPAALLLLTSLHLGSFFAGDDLGGRTTLAIGNLVPGDEGHHPVALYATVLTGLACLASLVTLVFQTRRQPRHGHRDQPSQTQAGYGQLQPGRTFGTGLAGVAIARFLVDEFRPGYLLPSAGIPGLLRVDQMVLIALAVAGLLLLLDRKAHHAQ